MSERSLAAWCPDPYRRFEMRYWDGVKWTEHVVSGGEQGVDRLNNTPPAEAQVLTPAGWHPDPFGRYELRYWDGTRWTDHVHSRGLRAVDPPTVQASVPPDERPSKQYAPQFPRASDRDGQRKETLHTAQVLVVNQKVKTFGPKLGYAVLNQRGQQIGMVQELRRDLSTTLRDNRRGRTEETREHRFRLTDTNDRVVLEMTRPRRGFFQTKNRLVVDGPGGTPIGQIVHESMGVGGSAATAAQTGVNNATAIARWGVGGLGGRLASYALSGVQQQLDTAVEGWDKVGHARFGLEASGRRLASVHAEDTKKWDFYVQDANGTEVARITKTWAGWAKERFTKADNYVVLMNRPLEEPLRILVIAAAFAIDMELKQHGDQTRGSSLWGTRTYK